MNAPFMVGYLHRSTAVACQEPTFRTDFECVAGVGGAMRMEVTQKGRYTTLRDTLS